MALVGRSVESATVGVSRSGSVMFAPLDDNSAPAPANVVQGPEWVARSRNLGGNWTELESGGPITGGLVPPWMDVDPVTSRIWFVTTLPTLCGARVSWSDDDGKSWHSNPKVGCPGMGSERVLEGPAPRNGAKPSGYRHVVYYCGNGTDVAPSKLYCYKSLDGGRRFSFVGGFPDPPSPSASCGVSHPALPGVVGPDGVLYFPLDLCGKLAVAISGDEGATWRRLPVAATNIQDLYITSVATDASGNLYIAWVAGSGQGPGVDGSGLPYLVVSRDRGRRWSKPMGVAPSTVQQVRHVAVTATGRGHVALTYLGSTDGGATFDGYIAEFTNTLARRPVFWSAVVNNPSQPLMSGSRPQVFGDRLFFISDAFGPDGTPWAALQCAYEKLCPNERVGVVARLATS
jgi:hypothetical protein